MILTGRLTNLVLGGGGVKGLAYIGTFEEAGKRNIRWGSIAGVSAGALAGALLGAGYGADELKYIIDSFNLSKIKIDRIPENIPIVAKYLQLNATRKPYVHRIDIDNFLNNRFINRQDIVDSSGKEIHSYRGNLLQNIITFGKEGCICDGDYLEEWVARVLASRGVFTFADLKGGIADRVNPGGYKVRMTAVDLNRARVIVLPDDITFYGIDPDKLSVAKAIRMSTSVPFAFKPVELKKREGSAVKTYHIVDGGVLDGFPFWAIDNSMRIPALGFMLDGESKDGLLSVASPLDIFKAIISVVHDTGVPKNMYKTRYIGVIDTSKVGFLDFSIGDDEKSYLYDAGKRQAELLINRLEWDLHIMQRRRYLQAILSRLFGIRRF